VIAFVLAFVITLRYYDAPFPPLFLPTHVDFQSQTLRPRPRLPVSVSRAQRHFHDVAQHHYANL
jgi:hypothetical protein